MFTILLIKFNSLTIRTRLLAGLSVGLILILLISLIGYKIFCYDDLMRYVSKNTQIYLHLDNRSVKDNFYKLKVIDALLKSFELEDFDRHLIGSELAVLCDSYQQEPACGLIIRLRPTASLRQYLTAKQIFFHELDSNTIIVGLRENWLSAVKKSFNPFRYFKYQSAIGKYGSLTLILNQPVNKNDELSKILHLGNFKKPIKLNGAITNQGLVLKTSIWPDILNAGWKQIKKEKPVEVACDLLINSQQGSDSKELNDYIIQLFSGPTTPAVPDWLDQPFNICLNKTDSTGNLIFDYDIIIGSGQQLSAENIQTLEKILLNLASYSRPTEKNFYLNDGTRISELWPQPDKLSFESTNEIKSIKLNDSQTIFYSNTSEGLLIGNKIGLNMPNNFPTNKNYLSIRINSLPDGRIKELFSDFSYLIASDGLVIIK